MVSSNDSGTAIVRIRDARVRVVSIAAALAIVAGGVLAGVASAATQVDLGTAGSFAVLAGSAITNTGPTTITGDVGLHPGSAVSGFADVTQDGELHVADATASQAKDDLVLAYDNAVGQGPASTVSTELGGQLLPGGVYDSADGTFGITGTLTLDAQGTPSTVWIFQTDSTLITASDSIVALINGADACNVFWQVGSSATLGTGTSFAGNILALTSVTLNTSATIRGSALARNGAVTLDTNTITNPGCASGATPTETPTDTPTVAPTETPTVTPTEPSTTPTDTTGAPTAGTTTGTPQVPDAPIGSVAAGDGSTTTSLAADRPVLQLLLPALVSLVLLAAWRRRVT